jgi:hypothetical protein
MSATPARASATSREVLVAGRIVPSTASSTRGKHARALLGTRRYALATAIFAAIVFVAGSATGNVWFALFAPFVVLGIAMFLVWREASKHSQRDFFQGYALRHGFIYAERMSLLETTPLLGAGDRRHCEHYMEGPLSEDGDLTVGITHYIFETAAQRRDRRNRPIQVYTPNPYTICVVELTRAMTVYPGIFLSRRGGLFGGREDHLDRPSMLPVELESSELMSKYELLTRSHQDRTRLMELFQPSFQTWLTTLPFQIYFEYSGGTLVVYTPKKLKDAHSLDVMLKVTDYIADRIQREGEPLRAVDSKPPPAGAGAFPAPPPATKPDVEPTPRIEAVPDPAPLREAGRGSVPPPGMA